MSSAILFDLDGTLLDSRGTIVLACNVALTGLGYEPLESEVVGSYVGDGAKNLLRRALGEAQRRRGEPERADEDEVARALEFFLRHYERNPIEKTSWIVGAHELLLELDPKAVGLVTNKTRSAVERVLDALSVRDRFGSVVAGGDGPLKPDPAPVLRALSELGAVASRSFMIGDGIQDVLAGKAAGCRTIALTGGFTSVERLRASGPDVVVGSFAELRRHLGSGP